ncbi:hypothetical protein LXA43DRAFT_1094332 [Ganoderma leucocontextum]|nr:hypothetical protein LXA43DRAFT_1094332 [Ganoderma leucocontextum]
MSSSAQNTSLVDRTARLSNTTTARAVDAPLPPHPPATARASSLPLLGTPRYLTTPQVVPVPGQQPVLAHQQHVPPIPTQYRERHTQYFLDIGRRVAVAAAKILGDTVQQIGLDLLILGAGFLQYSPIPGLEGIAHTLVDIWRAVQLVHRNKRACLDLAGRCANIVASIYETIRNSEDHGVATELEPPLERLTDSPKKLRNFLDEQAVRHFLKRLLEREQVVEALDGFDKTFTTALNTFMLAVQIRILKQGSAAERHRRADTATILQAIRGIRNTQGSESQSIAIPSAINTGPSDDGAYDIHRLRPLFRAGLQAKTFAELKYVFQRSRSEEVQMLQSVLEGLDLDATDG